MKNQSTDKLKQTRYPIVLVHGIILKDIAFFKAFGRIEKILKRQGYKIYTAKTDGFGTVENNAEQLKSHIQKILALENADKVNIIAHSKGGIDSLFMIEQLDAKDLVASLTTLCTPHKGSPIASRLLKLPKFIVKFIAFWINLVYRIFGDKHPDSLKVCKQLQLTDETREKQLPDGIYCQSYSTVMEKCRDDFIMSIPFIFSKRTESLPTDGLVSVESSKFGEYKGNCVDRALSHSQIVGFAISKKKKERIYEFYLQLCDDLFKKGF